MNAMFIDPLEIVATYESKTWPDDAIILRGTRGALALHLLRFPDEAESCVLWVLDEDESLESDKYAQSSHPL